MINMDKTRGTEAVRITKSSHSGGAKEVHGIRPIWKIEKRRKGEKDPYEVLEYKGNVFLNSGINRIWEMVAGENETPFDETNAEIGVGDGDAVEDPTHTELQGASQEYANMVTGYPTHGADQKIVFRAEFGDNDANFTWNEITVRNGGDGEASPINLNRLVQSMGTKVQDTEWIAELTLKIE